jgi:hypothetical protein
MQERLSVIDPTMRQAARAHGRGAAFNFLSKTMMAILFAAVMAAMGLVSALLRYLQAPRWIDDPGLIFVLGIVLGCAAVFAAAARWRWKLFRFVVRNAWWPRVAIYRRVEVK